MTNQSVLPNGNAPIDVSIVITNYNTRALLLDCLASIPAALGDLHAEVIVVDNGSTDGSLDALRSAFPTVRVIANQTNQGFVRGNNQGFAVSVGRYVLMLNSDAFPHAHAIEKMVHLADSHDHCGIVGARLLFPDGTLQNSWADFPTLASEMTGRNLQRNGRFVADANAAVLAVDWVSGAAMLCRKSMLDALGGLDEAIFMYSEETDLCYRARKAGRLVLHHGEALVTHLGGASSSSHDIRKLKLLYGGKLYFFQKHYGPLRALLLRVGLVVATLFGLLRWSLRALLNREARGDVKAALTARWQLLAWLVGGRPSALSSHREARPTRVSIQEP